MTTSEEARSISLGDLGISREYIESVRRMSRCNEDFYADHEQALWEAHPGKWLLIHDGANVEAFDELENLTERLDELDPITRASAFHMRQTDKIWIL